MKKLFFLLAVITASIGIFSFTSQQKKHHVLDHKWFRYRTGEMGVPTATESNAKTASYYAFVGDNPYCGGTEGYCGLFAEPSDETSSALPIITGTEISDIEAFFDNPGTYSGSLVDRKVE